MSEEWVEIYHPELTLTSTSPVRVPLTAFEKLYRDKGWELFIAEDKAEEANKPTERNFAGGVDATDDASKPGEVADTDTTDDVVPYDTKGTKSKKSAKS